MTDQTDLAEVLGRLRTLEAEVAELHAENRRLRHSSPAATPPAEEPTASAASTSGPTTVGRVPDREPLDRRRLLTRAGTAAVGAVIGGAVASVASASPAAAATGTFDTDSSTPALTATTTGTGPAIQATSTGDAGMSAIEVDYGARVFGAYIVGTGPYALLARAINESAVGVAGHAVGGIAGVAASGTEGANGVYASSSGGVGVVSTSTKAQFQWARFADPALLPAPQERDDEHQAGEVYFDNGESLWLCVADGAPGTWVRLAGPGTAGAFTVLPSPVRVYDTRPDTTPTDIGPKTQLTAFQPRQGIELTTNTSGVPTDATAATISVTVANTAGGSPTNPGYLTIYPSDTGWPGTSNLNWTTPDAITAVTTTVALGPDATIAAYTSHACDLIIDVIGYHR